MRPVGFLNNPTLRATEQKPETVLVPTASGVSQKTWNGSTWSAWQTLALGTAGSAAPGSIKGELAASPPRAAPPSSSEAPTTPCGRTPAGTAPGAAGPASAAPSPPAPPRRASDATASTCSSAAPTTRCGRSAVNGEWTGWTSCGGTLSSSPTAVSGGSGQIEVFAALALSNKVGQLNVYARATDNTQWQRYRTGAGPTGAWQQLDNTLDLTGSPAAAGHL
ncbi:hypothetical protein [Kitasatospora indigofera]|uniref:hypothetical protein n=1 Tax=Kitasatospora indigofera TaxID=67307 RepID=UPI0033B6D461